MSTTRRLALAVDDPLEPRSESTSEGVVARPAAKAPKRATTVSTPAAEAPPAAAPADVTAPNDVEPGRQEELWRAWSGASRPASYRLPDELLAELEERTHALRAPIGLTVTAALLRLLDEDDETILAAVDRAEDAQHHARRSARRRRGENLAK